MQDAVSILTHLEEKMERRRSLFQAGRGIEMFKLDQKENEQLESEISHLVEMYKFSSKPTLEIIEKMKTRLLSKFDEQYNAQQSLQQRSVSARTDDDRNYYYQQISKGDAELADLRKLLDLL